jgi:hypothetical protein
MSEKPTQSYAHHLKFVRGYHVYLFGGIFLHLLWSFWQLFQEPGIASLDQVLIALILLGLLYYIRAFPLKVQDRLIRLEERLRLTTLLPEELRGRITELRPRQLVALRFASDEEIPELVRLVLDQDIKSSQEIKQKIKTWRPDHFRC